VEVLAQIADALARAHAAGIVHRDLKPENIMIARGGYPKIVDFGVAKLTERTPGPSPADSDTAPNALLGTAAYMAPEQVEARPVDHRADVFAFGCVMHAVFGGRSPFARASTIDTMHAVLHDDAPPLPHAAPSLQRVARRCLARDPEERYQSMRDVALDLREWSGGLQAAGGVRMSARLGVLIALLLVVIAGSVGSVILARRDVPPPQTAAEPPLQAQMLRLTNSGRVMGSAVSPDGNYLVYTEQQGNRESMLVKQIATARTVRIIPPSPAWFYDLHVSADGNYVFYVSSTHAEPNVGNLYQMPILGGEATLVAADVETPIALSADARQVAFRRFNALQRENIVFVLDVEKKSERIVLLRRPPDWLGCFAWSPDGNRLTFVAPRAGSRTTIGLFDLELATGRIEPIAAPPWPGIGTLCWLPDASGLVLTVSDRRQTQQPPQLWYLPRDGGGKARKITNDIAAYEMATPTADSKALVARRTEGSANIAVVRLTEPDKPRALTADVGNHFGTGGVRWLSANEIVYTASASGRQSLNVMNVDTGQVREIVRGCCTWNPAVSPDGTRIAAQTNIEGRSDIVLLDRDGNRVRQFATGGATVPTWFPDGQSLAYVSNGSTQHAFRQPLGAATPLELSQLPVNSIRVSPDGRSMLCRYRRQEPGKPLWRTAVLPLGGGEPRFFAVPRLGGPHLMEWSRDGRGFYFCDSQDDVANIWYQPLDGSAPRQVTRFENGRIWGYDLSADGKSMVVSHGDVLNDAVLLRDFR